MKKHNATLETSWVRNLPEVGEPIKDHARRIAYAEFNAEQAVVDAIKRRREIRKQLRAGVRILEKKVQSLWTPDEIATAKIHPRLGWGD